MATPCIIAQKQTGKVKAHKTHPCLGSQQRGYKRRAWAIGSGGKGVGVEPGQGCRRQAGQTCGVGDGTEVLGPVVQSLLYRCSGECVCSLHLVLTELVMVC